MIAAIFAAAFLVMAGLFVIAMAGYQHERRARHEADVFAAAVERLADVAFEYLTLEQAMDAVDVAELDTAITSPEDIDWARWTA